MRRDYLWMAGRISNRDWQEAVQKAMYEEITNTEDSSRETLDILYGALYCFPLNCFKQLALAS